MDIHELATNFSLLTGMRLHQLSRDGKDVRMALHGKERNLFLTLSGCTDFLLQPFANAVTLIHDLDEILRLQPVLVSASPMPGGRVRLMCDIRAKEHARIIMRMEDLLIYDEEFDPMDKGALESLQAEAGLQPQN